VYALVHTLWHCLLLGTHSGSVCPILHTVVECAILYTLLQWAIVHTLWQYVHLCTNCGRGYALVPTLCHCIHTLAVHCNSACISACRIKVCAKCIQCPGHLYGSICTSAHTSVHTYTIYDSVYTLGPCKYTRQCIPKCIHWDHVCTCSHLGSKIWTETELHKQERVRLFFKA